MNAQLKEKLQNNPIVDREFAERFLWAVDRPMEYGVYFLFHDWWEEAPQTAIDAYMEQLHAIPGATDIMTLWSTITCSKNLPPTIERSMKA